MSVATVMPAWANGSRLSLLNDLSVFLCCAFGLLIKRIMMMYESPSATGLKEIERENSQQCEKTIQRKIPQPKHHTKQTITEAQDLFTNKTHNYKRSPNKS